LCKQVRQPPKAERFPLTLGTIEDNTECIKILRGKVA